MRSDNISSKALDLIFLGVDTVHVTTPKRYRLHTKEHQTVWWPKKASKKDFLLMLKSQENLRKIDMKKCRRSEQTWWLLQWVVIYFESQMLSSSYFFPTHDQFFHHHVCCFVAEMNVRKRGSEKIHTCLQPDIATNVEFRPRDSAIIFYLFLV